MSGQTGEFQLDPVQLKSTGSNWNSRHQDFREIRENRTEKQVSSSVAAQCGDRARAGGEEEQDVHAARWHGVGACRQRKKMRRRPASRWYFVHPAAGQKCPLCPLGNALQEMPSSSFWAQTTATWLH